MLRCYGGRINVKYLNVKCGHGKSVYFFPYLLQMGLYQNMMMTGFLLACKSVLFDILLVHVYCHSFACFLGN